MIWSAAMENVGVCCLVMQELVFGYLLLGDARTGAVGLAGCGIIMERGIVRRSEMIPRRLSEIALKRAGYDFCKLAQKRAI